MPGTLSDEAILKDLLGSDREYPVTPITMIGRDDDVHIRIDSKHVSRKHAKIILGTEGYYLEDMSRNGTFVNGDHLMRERRLLREGDIIEILKNRGASREKPVFRSRLQTQEAKVQNGILGGLLGLFSR